MESSVIEPKAMALRGVHEGIIATLERLTASPAEHRVLDVGAGQGALSKRLHEAGYQVSACEFNTDNFVYHKVECKAADVARTLPYPDNSFDVVIAAELIEHLTDQEMFLAECARVLKSGGIFLMSTPNILSMKSRLQFFVSGYYWSFGPLDMDNRDGLQHITARTYEQYQYLAKPVGFDLIDIDIDKPQSTSRSLLLFLPLMHLVGKTMRKDTKKLNHRKALLGRIIILCFKKNT